MGRDVNKFEIPELPGGDFKSQLHDLISSLELQSANIRYSYRLSRDYPLVISWPKDEDKLLLFLAATDWLHKIDVQVDWFAWYEGLM